MNSNTCIALDAMSGDLGPEVVVAAAATITGEHADLRLIIVGDEKLLGELLEQQPNYQRIKNQIEIVHASEVVTMSESPALALRNKKDSSMRVAINMVKKGRAEACISAGNTGALMATARFVLKMISGIDRPAICCAIPAEQGHTYVMDLGANVGCSSEHLYQFALMGSVLANAIDENESPRVGLLNIGTEEIKGNDIVKQAHQRLNDSALNYIGYVEGNDLFGSNADVVVTDGFVGNVALKTIEGVVKHLADVLREEFNRTWLHKLMGLVAWPVLRGFKRRVDPRRFNGASLLGLQAIVLKSHGGADKFAWYSAIRMAMLEVTHNVIGVIDRQINANGNGLN